MTCTLVDFHCHLDLYPDFELLVRECDSAGIHTLAVTTTPRAWARNHELASRTRYVIPALGLHPQLVSNHAHEIDLWESLLPDSKYVGEVGLDSGPQYYRSLEIQKKIFQRVLQACDSRGGKVLSVHSVRSAATVLDMIERHLSPVRSRVVLHWFTGSIVEARRAVDLGCYFSVNAQMATGARTGKIIEMLPSDRILTETDGPFTNSGGRQSRPRDVAVSLRAIADVRKTPLKDVESLVVENFKRITSAFE